MKEVLAWFLLLSVVNAERPWGGSFHHTFWNKHFQLPKPWFAPGRLFNPPGHTFTPPGHSINPPEHTLTPPPPPFQEANNEHLLPYQILKQIFSYKVTQLENDISQSCAAAWICRNPETGDMVIIDTDGQEIRLSGQPQQNDSLNQNDKQGTSTPSMQTSTPQPAPDESTKPHGGEGMIDVRIAAN